MQSHYATVQALVTFSLKARALNSLAPVRLQRFL